MQNWVTLTGRPARIRITDYLIDWQGDSLSYFQERVKAFLRTYWERTKVVCEELPVSGTRMSIDIVNITDRIAVECQGEQHESFNAFMHDDCEANYRAQLKRDLRKEEWCRLNGLTFVEIYQRDLPLTAQWFKDKYSITL